MAFTDRCDLFASFHEDGFNRILEHVRLQRPSLFNYATAEIAEKPGLLCHAFQFHPIVTTRGNPLVTVVDLLPIPGTPYGMNFAVQLAKLQLDLHPGNQFNLPPELAPLQAQRFAIIVQLCGGVGCPPKELSRNLVMPPKGRQDQKRNDERATRAPLIPIETRGLICFCLDAFVTGSFQIKDYAGKPYLEPVLEGFEIVDIRPERLESSIECYVRLMLELAVLPQLRILLESAPLQIMKGVSVVVNPVPVSPMLPNNPAVEDNQLKAFIKLEVI